MEGTWRAAVRRPISWLWVIFLWGVAVLSFNSLPEVDGVGHAVCGVGFLLLGVNAFLHPMSFNRPMQRLKQNPNPSVRDAALSAGGPVLIIVGVVIRGLLLA